MRRLIIADSHIGTVEGDVEAMIAQIDRAERIGINEILYLGDVFVYLIGMRKFWTRSVEKVLSAWDRVREKGVRIALIEGNRDFFLDEPDLADRVDETAINLEFQAGATTFRLVHGDTVNKRDRQYLFWSWISKSAMARLWARLLPRSIAVAIVRGMEARLAKTNRRFRYRKPVEALQNEARQSFDEGVDVLFFGHFHSLWTFEAENRVAMVVPAWLETRTAVIVEDDGRWYAVGEDFERQSLTESEAAND